jgi:hypothetical protein
VEIGCAVTAAADAAVGAGGDADPIAAGATGEDCARLRFGARFFLALATDFLAAEMERASIVAAGAAADGAADKGDDADCASCADDGDASMVVASPKASVSAALIAAGDASFDRLRLLERVLLVRAADFWSARAPALSGDAAGADAFRFLDMGV